MDHLLNKDQIDMAKRYDDKRKKKSVTPPSEKKPGPGGKKHKKKKRKTGVTRTRVTKSIGGGR